MVRDPLPIGTHGVINLTRIRPRVWRARTNYRDARGVRRNITAQAPTKAAAEHKLKTKLAALPAAGAALSGSTTLKVALQRWLDGLDGLATNTTRNYALWAGQASTALGSLQLRELTAGTLIQKGGWQADTKTHEPRTLQVPRFVLDVLRRRHSEARDGAVHVFEQGGAPLAYNSARNYLQRALAGSELEWVTWHVLRRTTATFLDERLGLAEASAQLGHASEAQTLAAYVARERQAVFADVLEGLAGA